MAIYWLDGFDTYQNSDRLRDVYELADVDSGFATGVINNAVALTLTNRYFEKQFNPVITSPTLYAGVHMFLDATGTFGNYIVRIFEESSNYIELSATSSGELRILRNTTVLATSSPVLLRNAFYHVKIYLVKSTSTSGICRVWYNNILAIDYTGQTATASTNTTRFRFSCPFSANYLAVRYDNLYLADEDLGELFLLPIRPVANGNYVQFTPQGASSNWDCVDELTTADSAFTFSSTDGAMDTYKFTDSPLSSGYIRAVVPAPNLSKSLGDFTGARVVVRFNNTDWVGNMLAIPPTSNREFLLDIIQNNPITNNAWALSEFSGANRVEFGIRVVK